MALKLEKPALQYLASYEAALRQGWSPNTVRPEAAREQLDEIKRDAMAFVAGLDDPDGKGEPIKQPDGSHVSRLPGFQRWLWDGEFSGNIRLTWQKGTTALPSYCLGHIGFTVVPWKQKRGYATRALALLLPEAQKQGLAYVEVTANPDNLASHKVILANGGQLIERFQKPTAYGGGESLRFRIAL